MRNEILNVWCVFFKFKISWNNVSVAETDGTTETNRLESVSPPYRMGPNDILDIYVWKEPELTREVIVTPDGRIRDALYELAKSPLLG